MLRYYFAFRARPATIRAFRQYSSSPHADAVIPFRDADAAAALQLYAPPPPAVLRVPLFTPLHDTPAHDDARRALLFFSRLPAFTSP